MTTYSLPPSLSALIDTEIATYIERYVPTTLSEPQWRVAQSAVCEMAARTGPTSRTDARTVLSALCRFLAWAEPLTGSLDLNVVLTASLVERFAGDLEGEISEGGRDNHRGRLRRCLRVMAGEPARTKRGARPTGAHPYNTEDIDRLISAAHGENRLARALALTSNQTVESERRADEAGGLTEIEWDAARRAAERAGVTLTQDRLRATRLHEVLQRPEPLVVLVRREQLTRRGLENAIHHLPIPGPEQERALLRG